MTVVIGFSIIPVRCHIAVFFFLATLCSLYLKHLLSLVKDMTPPLTQAEIMALVCFFLTFTCHWMQEKLARKRFRCDARLRVNERIDHMEAMR
eukprot:CAMPEP_0195136708 /NCGR_PEP_ID=MMETSP0448-20130528/154691_1 /TAXON_ID=66468 /ORGANISM="Heterocapsa triquestra, Strain CCMP 448" /LENGTH=92 /DNA_ID=CAMNT_0040174905 /DNA_START=13 /DNA_END=287 /DNA_ORIENTATION=+